jgi:hypothetical protein
MHQNYTFKAAFAIIFTLKPITGIRPRSLITEILQQYSAADDYHACSSTKVSLYSSEPSSKGSTTVLKHFLGSVGGPPRRTIG